MGEVMDVAVLGSSSFMGSFLVDSLLTNGYEVVGIHRTEKNDVFKSYLKNINFANFVDFKCDINNDYEDVITVLDHYEPRIVINCVALGMVDTSWDVPCDYFTTNCVSLARIAHHLVACGYLEKFMQASTPELYGNIPDSFPESKVYRPSTPYAASKASFDMYLDVLNKQYDFPAIMFRAANIYGAHQQLFRIIPKIIVQIKKQEKLVLDGNGISRRYFVHSSDLSDGIIKLINIGKPGIYHFAGDEYVSVKDLVIKVCSLMNYDYDKLVTISSERRGKDIDYNLNCDKARHELDWSPKVRLDCGINETEEWINANWEIIKNL